MVSFLIVNQMLPSPDPKYELSLRHKNFGDILFQFCKTTLR